MTREEEALKFEICKLLLKKGHRKYAERLSDRNLSLNLVDSSKKPDFIAAISFEDAIIYISDAFLEARKKQEHRIFDQLDTIMRHELAHNLMMHQIRMMYVFKTQFANDNPDEAYEQVKYSMNLHKLLNWLEDFEISNERYTIADKEIARNIEINGKVLHGLVTEDHRDWVDDSLEVMYKKFAAEVENINNKIRNDPSWQPLTDKGSFDSLSYESALMISSYYDPESYSNLNAYGISLADIENDTGAFKEFPSVAKRIAKSFYSAFKDFKDDLDKVNKIKDILKQIAASKPDEKVTIKHPDTGAQVGVLYTADFKALVSDILKKIIEKPIKLSQDYVDAWTKVMEVVGPMGLSNSDLDTILGTLMQDLI